MDGFQLSQLNMQVVFKRLMTTWKCHLIERGASGARRWEGCNTKWEPKVGLLYVLSPSSECKVYRIIWDFFNREFYSLKKNFNLKFVKRWFGSSPSHHSLIFSPLLSCIYLYLNFREKKCEGETEVKEKITQFYFTKSQDNSILSHTALSCLSS